MPASSPRQAHVLRAALDALAIPGAVAAFDLDSTLLDNRPRQARIIREFGAAAGIAPLEKCAPAHFDGWDLRIPLSRCGLSDAEVTRHFPALRDFWRARFFTSDYCDLDVPIPGAPMFVQSVIAAGARVVYLTGRHEPMRNGTLSSLGRGGFPLPDREPRAELWLKPTFDIPDDAWKESAFERLRAHGTVTAAFDNEPTHVNGYRVAFPSAHVVHLKTDHSGRPVNVLANISAVEDFRL